MAMACGVAGADAATALVAWTGCAGCACAAGAATVARAAGGSACAVPLRAATTAKRPRLLALGLDAKNDRFQHTGSLFFLR